LRIASKALGAWYVQFGIDLYISNSFQIVLILVKRSLTHLSTIRIEDQRHLHVWREKNFPLRCSKHLKLYINVHNSLGDRRRNRIQDCCWENQKLIEKKRKCKKIVEVLNHIFRIGYAISSLQVYIAFTMSDYNKLLCTSSHCIITNFLSN
jgi:hypothetical protein